MYLMIGTHSDLGFAIGKLAEFCESLTLAHWNAVKHVLQIIN